MTRKEFIKMCGLLGIALPIPLGLSSCQEEINNPVESDLNVLIIGAGAAGMTTGYLLKQAGINFTILEASNTYGGRMKRTNTFVDFPVPLGAEWLHVERGVFDEIINDSSINYEINTTPYDPNVDFGLFEGMQISTEEVGFTIDQKFINATWFDFFERYIYPSVQNNIIYNTIVDEINYAGENVTVNSSTGSYEANKVVVTVPVKILQNGVINFIPELPDNKLQALNEVTVWDGCKAFIEFSEKFYPAFTAFDITPESAGQKLYYDASYGQNSNRHVLGLFAVGTGTLPYVNLNDSDLIAYMLQELDEIYNGQASQNYVQHIFQNWNAEPFANGAYLTDQEDWRNVRTLGEYVGQNLLFAGDGYTEGNDWSSVHTAARSAIRAVNTIRG